MELTESQFQRIADCLPRQRGNVGMTNLQLLNALLYVVEHGCKWRGLPKHFGNWHTIYTRMNRWSKAGVLDRVFARLQAEQILAIHIEQVCLDSTTIKVHPDGTGAFKKNGPQAIGRSRGGWTTQIHLVAANDRCALMLKLSPGQAGDAPQGRELLEAGGPAPPDCLLIMDGAYEGDETLGLARQLGYTPIVPPNPNRVSPWEYDRVAYRRRNEIERLFRRLKGYRRVFCRYDKLDVLFLGFIVLALIVEALRFSVNRP
ncbi:MAG TPA: IS5 family transposase [Phycisphaerae bacterium]|nr:IS5 family transposase [Phycisphaerae bacterium]